MAELPPDSRYRGEYDETTAYRGGDVVLHEGTTYLATAKTSEAPPSDRWTVLPTE